MNRGALQKIVDAAELGKEDLVIEVGAGLGILTSELAAKAGKVLAVEIDEKLASTLRKLFSSKENVEIIRASILDIPPEKLLEQYAAKVRYKVVANIPYYITSPIIRHFLESSIRPSLMVLLVQREVGQQIVAAPGSTNLLNLSVLLYSRPKVLATIPAGNFYPRPKVDSVILRLAVFDKPGVPEGQIPAFFQVARAGFSAPRKQIRNSLAQGLNIKSADAVEMLKETGIAPERRPGTLSFDDWVRLKDAFIRKKKGQE